MLSLSIGLSIGTGTVVSGGGATLGPISLTDNFNDNSTDGTKWTVGTLTGQSTTGVTVAEANLHVEVTGAVSSAGAHYSGYVSVPTFDFTGKWAFVQLGHTTQQGSEVFHLTFGPDANNRYMMEVDSGAFYFSKIVASTKTFFGSVGGIAWSATTHKWLRIRHGGAGDDNIYMDAAPSAASNPPIAGDWVNLASTAKDAGFAITASLVSFGGGCYASLATPTKFIFDGFNTAT